MWYRLYICIYICIQHNYCVFTCKYYIHACWHVCIIHIYSWGRWTTTWNLQPQEIKISSFCWLFLFSRDLIKSSFWDSRPLHDGIGFQAFSTAVLLHGDLDVWIYLPRAQVTSILEGQPPKTTPFPTKRRVMWVPGNIWYIYDVHYGQGQRMNHLLHVCPISCLSNPGSIVNLRVKRHAWLLFQGKKWWVWCGTFLPRPGNADSTISLGENTWKLRRSWADVADVNNHDCLNICWHVETAYSASIQRHDSRNYTWLAHLIWASLEHSSHRRSTFAADCSELILPKASAWAASRRECFGVAGGFKHPWTFS